jgi:AcrR family transcriptional regulator
MMEGPSTKSCDHVNTPFVRGETLPKRYCTVAAFPTGQKGSDTMTRGTQQRIRDTALELLIAEGVKGFTIDEICRRSGIAKTTIYRHWPSVHDLLVDTVASQIEHLPTPDTGGLRSDLGVLFGQVMSMPEITGKRRMMLGLMQAATDDQDLRNALNKLTRERSLPVRNVLQHARQRRELPDSIDLDHAIDLIEGPIVYRYMIRGDAFAQHDLDAILDLIVAGLTRPPDTRA